MNALPSDKWLHIRKAQDALNVAVGELRMLREVMGYVGGESDAGKGGELGAAIRSAHVGALAAQGLAGELEMIQRHAWQAERC